MNYPLVSFCVPTYNRALFLGDTLESVLAQTITNFEIVVVNDVSPDHTEEIVRRYSDSRIRYFRNDKNLGVPENLNRTFSLARGEYFCLLEDHDLISPNYLEKMLEIMTKYPKVAFATSGIFTIDEKGRKIQRYVERYPKVIPGKRMLRTLLIRTTCPFSVTTLIRRRFLDDFQPPFAPKYSWYADQNLWMTLCAKGDMGYVADPLLEMRVRESDHFLVGKDWESILCLDEIHRDNWRLLHPSFSWRHLLDRVMHEIAKTWAIVRFRANKTFYRGGRWTSEDSLNSRKYLSPLGQFIVGLSGFCPNIMGQVLASCYRWRKKRRSNILNLHRAPEA